MSFQQVIGQMPKEVYERLKTAVELGKWPDGQPLTDEQKAKRAAHYSPKLGELRDQLTYWEQVRADQIATGKATAATESPARMSGLSQLR